ncbi:MAG: hypothetical protein IPP14_12220 [Planctomycetes bacterium]|nr:hypothetical protein [Planctomycetota bacterium]
MSGQTTLSGNKPQTGSLRRDGREGARALWAALPAHVVIFALACVLWWIARDMVAVNRTLRDTATVSFALDGDLNGQWRIVSTDAALIGLDVSGPTKEINVFASELEASRGRFGYRYLITNADLQNATPNAQHQITLVVDVRKFERVGEATVPAELVIKPIAGERTYQVTLEQFINRQAVLDLTGVNGKVEGYSFTARVQQDFEIDAFGPAGLIDAMTSSGNRAQLQIASIDVNQILRNKSLVEGKSIETLLRQGYLVSNLQLVPVEGLQIRRHGQNLPVAEAPVEFTFTELQDYALVSGEFAVNVILPNWLVQKGARLPSMAKTLPVELRVLSSQREFFKEPYVRVVVDLSQIKEGDHNPDAPEGGGPGTRRLRLSNLYYSIQYSRDKLTIKPFANPKITPDNYLPVEVEIVWVE